MPSGWKRLLLADGPRQTINALTLYSIYLAKKDDGQWYDVPKYFRGNSLSTSALTATTFFTFVIFVGSALLLIIAGIFYIPLLCYIQGNLKVRNRQCDWQVKIVKPTMMCRNMSATKSTSVLRRSSRGGTKSVLPRQLHSLRKKPWATSHI